MKSRLILFLFVMILITPIISPQLASFPDGSEAGFSAISTAATYASDLAEDVYNTVSLTTYRDFIIKLTENGSRTVYSDENTLAREWIISELEDVTDGRIEIEVLGSYSNIVGRLPGVSTPRGPAFAVGGHYDSVAGAPGANDDGTGVAAALELARVMSQYIWPLDIYFCFWNAEEIGLLGSQQVAPMFVENEVDLLAYFNVDMLLWEDPVAPPDERVLMAYRTENAAFHDAQYWAEMTRVMNNNFDDPVIRPIPQTGFPYWQYSDHYSFVREGYLGCLFAFESGSGYDTAYHTSMDTWDNPNYNYEIAVDAVASIGAAMVFAMGRTPTQNTHARYGKIIDVGASQDILLECSIESTLEARGIWEGPADLYVELRDSTDHILVHNEVSGTDGIGMALISSTIESFGLHTISITNNGANPLTLEVVLAYDEDIEGNGVPDHEESFFNKWDIDSDLDGICDADEIFMGFDRYNPDEDGDGINDYQEAFVYGTNPKEVDSDFDGMPDPYEIELGFDPSSATDGSADFDGDQLTNAFEYGAGTSPILADSDFDGLDDYAELFVYLTNAMSNDTDMDRLPDAYEVENGLNPLVDDSGLDPDGDGATNLEEYLSGTDPQFSEVAFETVVFAASIGIVGLVTIIAAIMLRRIT